MTVLSSAPAAGPPARAWARSRPERSRRTGWTLVNQPTVRVRSVPSSGSRPCPSTSTRSAAPVPGRRWATAPASEASRTSCAPQWNAAGARFSTAAAVAPVSVQERRRRVAAVSVSGSGVRVPSWGAVVSSRAVQPASSAVRAAPVAWAARRSAHRRKDVPTGSSSGTSPEAAASQAACRSGARMRQDTPSTTRWWATRASRPVRCGPASTHTARTITPAAGSSLAAASRAASSAMPSRASSGASAASVRVTSAAASTVPRPGTCSVGRSPVSARARSTAWVSSTAASPAVSTSSPSPAGAPMTIHWAKPGRAARSPSARITGVHGISPSPGSEPVRAAASAGAATAASRPGVLRSKT